MLATSAGGTLIIRLVTLAATFAAAVLAARLLGPELRGYLAVMIFFPGVLGPAIVLGLDTANLYFGGRSAEEHRDVVRYSVLYALVGGTLAVGAIVAIGVWVESVRLGLSVNDFALAVGLMPAGLLMLLLTAAESGRGRPWRSTLVAAAGMVAYSVMLLGLLTIGLSDPTAAFAAYAIAHVGIAIALLVQSRAAWARGRTLAVRTYITYGLGVYASAVPLILLMRMGVPILQLLSGPTDVGIYATVLPMAESILLLSTTVTLVALPRIASGELEQSALLDMSRVLFVVSLGVGLAIATAAIVVIPLLMGAAFQPGVAVLHLLIPGTIIYCASRPMFLYLLGRRRYRTAMVTAIVPFAVCLISAVMLTPMFGASGMAIAVTCAYISHALLVWVAAGGSGSARFPIPYLPTRRTFVLITGVVKKFLGSSLARLRGWSR